MNLVLFVMFGMFVEIVLLKVDILLLVSGENVFVFILLKMVVVVVVECVYSVKISQ